MKLLKQISTQFLVAIDIETVRYVKNFEDLSEDFQEAFTYKNKQDGVIPDRENLCSLWERTSSLYPEFSKVCAVSLAFLNDDGSKLYCQEFAGENEFEILTQLSEVLERIHKKNISYRLIGHAAKFFDYPFLCKRYVINGLSIPSILDTAHLKPWESTNLCSNEIWKMGGTGSGSSLQALCTVLGIPISKVDLVGDEVGKAYFDGELSRISRYCSYDTIATFNVVRRIKGEPIFSFDEVKYLSSVNHKIEKTPCLVELYNTKELSPKIQEDIRQRFSSNVSDKEWQMLEYMLCDLYINNKMFEADSTTIQEEKREKIKNFVKDLKDGN